MNAMMHRRRFLTQTWNGIGALGLAGMLAEESSHASKATANTLTPQQPHLPGQAKHCIFLFMQGGVSQMDAFEHKPMLQQWHGKPIPGSPSVRGELQGRLSFPHVCVGSPFSFQQHGDSGRWFSELFPHMAGQSDRMAFIHGIKTDNQNHGPSTYHVTTGSQFPGSPSVGSWIQYGLGTLNQNMPGYVVVQDPRGAPCNGAAVWANGYLPAVHQGTLLRDHGSPILNLQRPEGITLTQQREEFDAIRALNQRHAQTRPMDTELEARVQAYELAFRMQQAAPEAVDLSAEPESMQKLYGLDRDETKGFGRQCLLARRMVERGVRFTLLVHGVQIGAHSWDDHSNVEAGMRKHSQEVDQPVATLLEDLHQRGLLEDTLVVWASEMGRTPFVNSPSMPKNPGREHNSYGLCMWMAGGRVKAGATAGETDPFSLRSVDEPIHIRDVHATILHLMGLEDERLTFQHAGRIRKLTDIGGHILHSLIA